MGKSFESCILWAFVTLCRLEGPIDFNIGGVGGHKDCLSRIRHCSALLMLQGVDKGGESPPALELVGYMVAELLFVRCFCLPLEDGISAVGSGVVIAEII